MYHLVIQCHCLNHDLQDERMNRIKGCATNHGFRKFETGCFLRDKRGTVGQRVGWVLRGDWAGVSCKSKNLAHLPAPAYRQTRKQVLIQTREDG